ncbi:hypothetical protein [Desulfosediminicola flagellatus]|uniref:hypothetical protein n=1 Tax=Desulfosediminicola flagellatus TaxID=2569541 RepID=UPI0010AD8934|nr:hypothetical protein [Desulfosediminicola flagellatus]
MRRSLGVLKQVVEHTIKRAIIRIDTRQAGIHGLDVFSDACCYSRIRSGLGGRYCGAFYPIVA